MTVTYLRAQISAGAQAVQVFDSWVGALTAQDYRTYIAPTMHTIFEALRESGVPTIYFGVATGHLLEEWQHLPVDVIGLDWRTSIRAARARGIDKAIQGNLDPSLLLAPWEMIRARAEQILQEGMEEPGFIFNLGHGVFPEVDVATLQKLTAFVHEYSARK